MTDVVIDARTLSEPYRGFATYVRAVLAGLALRPDLSVSALTLPGTELPAGVRRIQLTRRLPARFASLEHDLRLPRDLSRLDADVFHSPADDPPRRSSLPWVQTLHGLLPLVSSAPELSKERRRWRRYAPRLRRAAAVITVSRFSAEQARTLLQLDPARLHVVYHGVDPVFRPAQGHGADPPYLLYVGEYGPWKGYAEAFDIIGRLAEAGYPHRLKVAGRIAPWVADTVGALARRSRRPDRIDLLGFVSHDGALPALYQEASLLVMTSRFETFGFPTAEAMACGLPVVAFRNSATPEILGDAGVLVDDGDGEAFVEAAKVLLDDEFRRRDHADRGIERARAFDWETAVESHAQILRTVADRG